VTYRISKTVLDRQNLGDFAARAATFAVEMKNWRAHMARVKVDEEAGVTGIDKYMPHPRPREHELVEAAVNENDEMDYELVDDTPPPEMILRAHKDQLLLAVSHAERDAIGAVIPPGRHRLFNLRENDIRQADSDRISRLVAKRRGIVKSLTDAAGISDAGAELAAELKRSRPAQDTQHLEDQEQRRAKVDAIERAAAQAHNDIEDLTVDNIDGWKTPDFKGI
jgi:hypothetical protein